MHCAHRFARKDISEPKRDWMALLDIIAFFALGFMVGGDCCERTIHVAVAKKSIFGSIA